MQTEPISKITNEKKDKALFIKNYIIYDFIAILNKFLFFLVLLQIEDNIPLYQKLLFVDVVSDMYRASKELLLFNYIWRKYKRKKKDENLVESRAASLPFQNQSSPKAKVISWISLWGWRVWTFFIKIFTDKRNILTYDQSLFFFSKNHLNLSTTLHFTLFCFHDVNENVFWFLHALI